MARIRSIKPDFFTSEDVSVLPLRARLTWIGLWTHCDDQGRAKDNVRLIKAALWPLDEVSLRDVEEDLVTLADHGRIVRYEVDGKRCLAIVNWHEHQSINRPSASKLPPPPDSPVDNSTKGGTTSGNKAHGGLTEDSVSPHARKGREGKGREGTRAHARDEALPERPAGAEPPSKCPRHRDDPHPPPCGACADARRANQEWQKTRADRHPSSRTVTEALAAARGES